MKNGKPEQAGRGTPVRRYSDGSLPFPPYGEMTEGLQNSVNNAPDAAPKDFAPAGDYVRVRTEIVEAIQRTLVPVWDEANQEWVSAASTPPMHAITAADLRLGVTVKSIMQTVPAGPYPSPTCPAHDMFYIHEDNNSFLDLIDHYDRNIGATDKAAFIAVYESKKRDKFGTVHLQLKNQFQRPRPHQTSVLLKMPPIKPKRAYTAGSPALPGGHGFQALLGFGAVLEEILKTGTGKEFIPALQQLAVDIGDRRVYGGLHYPSDAIGVWIAVTRLAPHVYRNPEVLTLLRQAITEKSVLYRRIAADDEYFKPALALI